MEIASTKFKVAAVAELDKVTSLHTTRVQPGFFMDFWGNRSKGIKSNFEILPMFIDIAHGVAAIPGDGNEPIIVSHTTDIGRFVAAMLDLEQWEPVSYIVGDKVTLNEMLAYAEESRGLKFTVTHDSVDKLRSHDPTELPSYAFAYKFIPKPILTDMACTFGTWFAEGVFNYDTPKSLNAAFPEIHTIKVQDFIQNGWGN
jgi:hypothetical protein